MANKMLIDASHPEETRVVVVRGNRIEEFDFESEHKKQIKGNIYLAKVTRVEPSLQAAFVEYGGNRHGFLAFSEIHPDYYQIPVADRQALMEDEMARVREEEEDEERKLSRPRANPRRPGGGKTIRAAETNGEDSVSEPVDPSLHHEDHADGHHGESDDHALSDNEHEAPELIGDDHGSEEGADDSSDDHEVFEAGAEGGEAAEGEADVSPSGHRRGRRSRSRRSGNAEEAPHSDDEEEIVDEIGAEDAMEEVPVRVPRAPRKQYKIQEVIKRRQILLVQVVKEERGNKGAALTTYLSLAGRYSVLMPNTARGGGISRKITNIADRKRLKEVARELEVPKGMGIILRTAGAMRTKAEVKRDYEYLMRLWETVRSLTLSSSAPALTYEEGSLIKRSIRDLYNKDIDQVLVSGEAGYREAKDFMRMLMPSQAKVVQPYRDSVPIFARGGIEAQLDKMLQPHVTLKSGGYIIINQTEALVAIDVNSGRSTREHSVEDTAYQTNLEAAEEVARQLRLRDLAGLIVIDFIDMEEKRNNRAVEKKMKECLKDDRARIQVGRISHFGLMEMSRQRIRASVLESTTRVCPTCDGVGHIRSNSSLALHVVRAVEEHLQKHSTYDLVVKVPTATALYVLNEKRNTIEELEQHYGLRIVIEADDKHGHQHVAIEHGAEAVRREPRPSLLAAPLPLEIEEEEDDLVAEEVETVLAEEPGVTEATEDADGEEQRRRKRRRRRRRGGSDDAGTSADADGDVVGLDADADGDDETEQGSEASEDDEDEAAGASADGSADDENGRNRKRRRRGRRGGRRNREGEPGDSAEGGMATGDQPDNGETHLEAVASESLSVLGDDGRGAANDDGVVEAFVAETLPVDEPHAEMGEAPAETYENMTPAPVMEEHQAVAVESFEVAHDVPAEVPAVETEGLSPEPTHEPAPVVAVVPPQPPAEPVVSSSTPEEEDGEGKPKRTGWWARRSFF